MRFFEAYKRCKKVKSKPVDKALKYSQDEVCPACGVYTASGEVCNACLKENGMQASNTVYYDL